MIVSAAHDVAYPGGNDFHDPRPNKRRKTDAPNGPSSYERIVQKEPNKQADFGAIPTLEVGNDDAPDDQEPYGIPSHPLGIRPLGNAWDARVNIKSMSGSFASLPDEALMILLEFLEARDLQMLGSTCKALYAFCRSEELWKTLFIESHEGPRDFAWRGTWRSTHLGLAPHTTSSISCYGLFSDTLYRPFHCAHLPLAPYAANIPARNAITRLPDLSPEEYACSWAEKPFILTKPVKEWPAYAEWSVERLLRHHSDTVFRAEAVDWPLRTYVEYMRDNVDESPLYLFDCHFAAKMGLDAPSKLREASHNDNHDGGEKSDTRAPAYTAPATFTPDLFDALAPHRPHNKWLIMGPARSGSTFHADPNGTAAWNAVLRGSKYWLMFPPPAPAAGEDRGDAARTGEIPGVHLSPDMAHIAAPLSLPEYLLGFHAAARATPGAVEAVCAAGEVLHVPAGWFHMVVNLDEGVAVTQNFVGAAGLAGALAFLRDRRDQVSGFEWGRAVASADAPAADAAGGERSRSEVAVEDGEGKEYELFVSRLRETQPELLDRALDALARRDREAGEERSRRQAGKNRRVGTRWEEVVKGVANDDGAAASGGLFSFGFEDEEDDEDEPGEEGWR